jgi:hypothetical protein
MINLYVNKAVGHCQAKDLWGRISPEGNIESSLDIDCKLSMYSILLPWHYPWTCKSNNTDINTRFVFTRPNTNASRETSDIIFGARSALYIKTLSACVWRRGGEIDILVYICIQHWVTMAWIISPWKRWIDIQLRKNKKSHSIFSR